MSNLGQLATLVGQRLGVDTSLGTSRDGAAVRGFLSLRHDQLYRAFLWKDSIIEMAVNPNTPYVPTSNYLPTKGRVILPTIFQHVLGARLGCRSLDVQRAMFFYRADYARFFNSGYAAEFMLLSTCVWEFDTVMDIVAESTNTAALDIFHFFCSSAISSHFAQKEWSNTLISFFEKEHTT